MINIIIVMKERVPRLPIIICEVSCLFLTLAACRRKKHYDSVEWYSFKPAAMYSRTQLSIFWDQPLIFKRHYIISYHVVTLTVAQVFCCICALSIAHSLHLLNVNDVGGADLLAWWLAERQCDSGGLNGRPEKQADVCYSWWILSALSIMGRVSWIDTSKLGQFILNCQDMMMMGG